jgi:hypothetical protein
MEKLPADKILRILNNRIPKALMGRTTYWRQFMGYSHFLRSDFPCSQIYEK